MLIRIVCQSKIEEMALTVAGAILNGDDDYASRFANNLRAFDQAIVSTYHKEIRHLPSLEVIQRKANSDKAADQFIILFYYMNNVLNFIGQFNKMDSVLEFMPKRHTFTSDEIYDFFALKNIINSISDMNDSAIVRNKVSKAVSVISLEDAAGNWLKKVELLRYNQNILKILLKEIIKIAYAIKYDVAMPDSFKESTFTFWQYAEKLSKLPQLDEEVADLELINWNHDYTDNSINVAKVPKVQIQLFKHYKNEDSSIHRAFEALFNYYVELLTEKTIEINFNFNQETRSTVAQNIENANSYSRPGDVNQDLIKLKEGADSNAN